MISQYLLLVPLGRRCAVRACDTTNQSSNPNLRHVIEWAHGVTESQSVYATISPQRIASAGDSGGAYQPELWLLRKRTLGYPCLII